MEHVARYDRNHAGPSDLSCVLDGHLKLMLGEWK